MNIPDAIIPLYVLKYDRRTKVTKMNMIITMLEM